MIQALAFPPGQALVVLGAYTLGFGALLVGASVAIAVGRRGLLDRPVKRRKHIDTAAVALVLAGVLQLVAVV